MLGHVTDPSVLPHILFGALNPECVGKYKKGSRDWLDLWPLTVIKC